jgi:hypothetical protein
MAENVLRRNRTMSDINIVGTGRRVRKFVGFVGLALLLAAFWLAEQDRPDFERLRYGFMGIYETAAIRVPLFRQAYVCHALKRAECL